MRNSIEFEARVRQIAAEKKAKTRKRISIFTSVGVVACACAFVLVISNNQKHIKNDGNNIIVAEVETTTEDIQKETPSIIETLDHKGVEEFTTEYVIDQTEVFTEPVVEIPTEPAIVETKGYDELESDPFKEITGAVIEKFEPHKGPAGILVVYKNKKFELDSAMYDKVAKRFEGRKKLKESGENFIVIKGNLYEIDKEDYKFLEKLRSKEND